MALIEINWNPDRRQLRVFGVTALAATAVLAGWVLLRHSVLGIGLSPAAAGWVAGIAVAFGVLCAGLALLAPGGARPLFVGLSLITLPIGLVVSHGMMALFYYGVLTPIGLVFHLLGRDPLNRALVREQATYWVRRAPQTDVKRYFRQF